MAIESAGLATALTAEHGPAPRDRDLLRARVLDRAFKPGQGWRANGAELGWSLDCREIALEQASLRCAARELSTYVARYRAAAVAGTGLSGAPLVAAIVATWGSHLLVDAPCGLLVRDSAKPSGLRRQVEGPLPPPGSRVVIVDDLADSGGTLLRVARVLREHGLEPVAAAVLVDFDHGASRQLRRERLELHNVFGLADLGIAAMSLQLPQPSVRWRVDGLNHPGDPVPLARPRAIHGSIVAGTNTGKVIGITAEGEACWQRTSPHASGIHTSPAAGPHDTAIFGTDDGHVFGIETADGAIRWVSRLADRIGGGITALGDALCVPATDGATGGKLHLLSAATGAVHWSVPLTAYTHARPAHDRRRGIVVGADNQGRLRAARIATGDVIWDTDVSAAVKSDLVIADDSLLAGSFDGTLSAIDLDDGSIMWQRRLGRRIYAAPVIADGLVVAGADEHAFGLELATGTVAWVAGTGPVRGEISQLDGQSVALTTLTTGLVTIAASGKPCSALRLTSATSGACHWVNNTVLIATGDGGVLAVDT